MSEASRALDAEGVARRVASVVAPGATVLVAGRGQEGLVAALDRPAVHFPRGPDGGWLGYHPSGDEAAIAQLELARVRGGDALVLPAASQWWLGHYRRFAAHLDSRYARVLADADCAVYDLRVAAPAPWPERLDAVLDGEAGGIGRATTVLDWGSGLDLVRLLPDRPVVARDATCPRLPDLEGTVDVVVLAGGDPERVAEARRVAAGAVVHADAAGAGIGRVERRRTPPTDTVRPVLVAVCDDRAMPAGRRLRQLRETFDGDVVAVAAAGSTAARTARAAAAADDRLRLVEVSGCAEDPGAVLAAALPDVEGPLVAVLAGDALPLPGWWRAAARALARRPATAAIAAVVRGPDGEVAPAPGSASLTAGATAPAALVVGSRDALARGPDTVVVDGEVSVVVCRPREPAPARPRPPERRAGVGHALVLVERVADDALLGPPARLVAQAAALAAGGWTVTFAALRGAVPAVVAHALGDRVRCRGPVRLEDVLAGAAVDLAILEGAYLAAEFVAIRDAAPAARIAVDCAGLERAPGSGPGTDGDDARAAVTAVHAAADLVLASHEADAARLRELCPGTPVACVSGLRGGGDGGRPFGGRPFDGRRGVLVAARPDPADLEGLAWLVEDVVPRLGDGLLDAHPIHVVGHDVGSYAAAAVRGAAGIRLVGAVPSFHAYLSRARVMACPAPAAPGVRPAVEAALACGLPLVVPGELAQALGRGDGDGLLVAGDAPSFAAATRRLLGEGEVWERTRRGGPRRPAVAGEDLCTVAAAALDRAPKSSAPPPEVRARAAGWWADVDARRVAARVRETVERHVGAGAAVAVVGDGRPALTDLGSRLAVAFPRRADGVAPTDPPDDAEELIREIDAVRGDGAGHLLVVRPQRWWLRAYPEFDAYLRAAHRVVVDDEHCLLVDLAARTTRAPRPRSRRPGDPAARLIAFYLPQYHPVPENDAWWGEGFTEWTKVRPARPLFTGHEQPHVPAELGSYDLRSAETRRAQADLARAHGLHGFCYYHYWFEGRRLLERPFEEVLATGRPDFPFCLCWANESWTRRWDGGCEDLLCEQTYSEEDDRAHIEWLLPVLADPRAITVDRRPLFLVYRARDLPDPARTVATWRRAARRAGLPGLHLVAVETARDAGWDATRVGFDAKLHFAPQFRLLAGEEQLAVGPPGTGLRVYDYDRVWPVLADPPPVDYPRYDTVCPRWDNTPRVGERGLVLHNSSPETYEMWLRSAIVRAATRPPERRLVFINAWNEWGEGCHLEPDAAHGRAYLEATQRALRGARERGRALVATAPERWE